MTRAFDKDVGPVALLVHDTTNLAVVINPGRRRFARKALDTAEGRVLYISSVIVLDVHVNELRYLDYDCARCVSGSISINQDRFHTFGSSMRHE